MKTRVTITLDPQVVRRAKSIARSRKTNLSALIEDMLTRTTQYGAARPTKFGQKWAGKFTARTSDGSDLLLDALKARYGIKQ